MPRQRGRDVEYIITIYGIPRAVTQQEDSWKIVKDAVRNLIDGQPKQVHQLRDSGFCLTVDSYKDAKKAHDALAGHSWYSVVGGGNDRASPIMGVSFVPSQQKGQVDYQLNASSSYQHGRRLSTASHTRTSSSSSTTSSMQSPPSSTVPYGLSPPSYLMRYPQVPVATGGFLPASMPPPPDTFNFLPAPAMMQPYGPGFGHPVDFGSSPAVYSQASLTRPRQEPRQHQIIIQNLSVDVKEMWLKDFLATSVGPVQMSIIEERGDKKRHAFVSFTHAEHANLAVIRFDGQLIAGRKVSVRLTKEKEALEIQNGPLVVDGSVEE